MVSSLIKCFSWFSVSTWSKGIITKATEESGKIITPWPVVSVTIRFSIYNLQWVSIWNVKLKNLKFILIYDYPELYDIASEVGECRCFRVICSVLLANLLERCPPYWLKGTDLNLRAQEISDRCRRIPEVLRSCVDEGPKFDFPTPRSHLFAFT